MKSKAESTHYDTKYGLHLKVVNNVLFCLDEQSNLWVKSEHPLGLKALDQSWIVTTTLKTKPFDLTKALDGVKVVTRKGLPVNDFHFFKSCSASYPLFAVIDGRIREFTKDGRCSKTVTANDDLFLVDETSEIKVGDIVYISKPNNTLEVLFKYDEVTFICEDGSGEVDKYRVEDLKLVPTEPEMLRGFINVYSNVSCMPHATKKDADKYAGYDRIACIDLSQFKAGHGINE